MRICNRMRRGATAAALAVLAALAGLPVGSGASGPPAKAAPAPGAASPKTPAPPAPPAAKAQATSDDFTLKGGQEGTVFRSLTIEGEDRIHVEFDRPALVVDLDPARAPGLDWGSARDVLDRTMPDLVSPVVTLSAREQSPYLGRPWLSEFSSGPVARFRPSVEGVARWRLMVVDAKGQTVVTFAGKNDPPDAIEWDGRSQGGPPVTPGLTYSYVFEAYDRAGNKRNFVGQGFSISAYHLESPAGPMLLFSAAELEGSGPIGRGADVTRPASPILLEAASWLNQSGSIAAPIAVTATARTFERANQLAQTVSASLAQLVIGDPARIRPVALAQPDAPAEGTLAIGPAR